MKLALQLGSLSLLNMAISFLFQWYVVIQLGPSVETDALFASMTIPQLVLAVVAGSLSQVLVPLFSGESDESLKRDSWGFLGVVLLLFGFVAIVFFLIFPVLLPLTVPGFSDISKQLTVELAQIQLIGMVLAALNIVQWAVYQARQKFIWAEVATVTSGIFAFTSLIVMLPLYGVYAVVWVSIFRFLFQGLLLLPAMGMPSALDFKSIPVHRAWCRIKPLLISSSYTKTEPLIDRFLLSSSIGGVLSIYALAQQMYGAANQILAKSISSPLVPILSRLHKANEMICFQSMYQKKITLVAIICSVGYMAFSILGEWFLTLLMTYGKFDKDDTVVLYWIFIWLGGVFVGGALGQITSSSYYAKGDTKSPAYISMITFTFYMPIKVLIFTVYSYKGLALLTSLYYLIDFLIMHIYQRRQFFN